MQACRARPSLYLGDASAAGLGGTPGVLQGARASLWLLGATEGSGVRARAARAKLQGAGVVGRRWTQTGRGRSCQHIGSWSLTRAGRKWRFRATLHFMAVGWCFYVCSLFKGEKGCLPLSFSSPGASSASQGPVPSSGLSLGEVHPPLPTLGGSLPGACPSSPRTHWGPLHRARPSPPRTHWGPLPGARRVPPELSGARSRDLPACPVPKALPTAVPLPSS